VGLSGIWKGNEVDMIMQRMCMGWSKGRGNEEGKLEVEGAGCY